MAVAPKFSDVNHDDESINRIQDHLAKTLDPLVASPLNGATLVKNVTVREGLNDVPHQMGTAPQGFSVVAQHGVLQPVGWTNMALTAPFGGTGFAPAPAYRITAQGKVELRGSFAAASAPAAGQALWTFPSTALGPTNGALGIGRFVVVPVSFNGTAFGAMVRLDVNPTNILWQYAATGNTAFGVFGTAAAVTSIALGGLDGISWDALGAGPVELASAQDKNPFSSSTYRLISSGAGVVDLIFF